MVSGMLNSLLRLGFFHGSLGLFGALGTSHGSLLALFLLELFAAEEFDKCGVGAIALAPAGADYAEVSTFAVSETGSDGVEQLVDSGARS